MYTDASYNELYTRYKAVLAIAVMLAKGVETEKQKKALQGYLQSPILAEMQHDIEPAAIKEVVPCN